MIEVTTQAHLAKAMQRAHQERAQVFSFLWSKLWTRPGTRARLSGSRWA